MEMRDAVSDRAQCKMQNSKCNIAVIALIALTAACTTSTSDNAPGLKELQRASAGGMTIVLLASGDALKSGKDTAYLEFRSGSDQHLTDVGTVKASATMPMTGMPPMMGSMFVHTTQTAGRYSIDTDLGMIGTWQIGVEWDGGPSGAGKVAFSGNVQ